MKKTFYHGLVMLGILTLTFTSCKKDKQTTDDSNDIVAVDENAQGDETFSDVFTTISNYSTQNDVNFTTNSKSGIKTLAELAENESPIVTVSGLMWPKKVTFDFGAGTTKNDITRKGKIVAVYSNKFKSKDAVITITFDSYYINDTKIEGTKTITNTGTNAAGNYVFSIVVSKSKINDVKGVFTYNANRSIEWLEGQGTASILDDVFSITGSSTGVNSKGVIFTTNITKPLIKKIGWPYLVAGIIEIKPGDRLLITLNYGNGELDAKATLTVNGVSREIYLRK